MRRTSRMLLLLAGLALLTPNAHAQIDPGCFVYIVYEAGVPVGQIFRTETGRVFTEHWVLFPNYVFPSAENHVRPVIRRAELSYANVSDFLGHTFRPGARYIKAFTRDALTLPTVGGGL